ncbi:MAG: AmmeMemoRadiSam system protein B [Elusimicrobia bacterium]|nr:AmmeMemoRadiSam system protein B [Elusimicrobiota bacterium]
MLLQHFIHKNQRYQRSIFFTVFIVLTFGSAGFAREAVFAGKFYPAEKGEIARFVDSALAKAAIAKLDGKILAVIAPHAGYVFSGRVAGYAYKTIDDQYDTVVILGASHTLSVKGAAILKDGFYETPLGKVPVDEKLADELIKASPLFEDNPAAHAGEHAVEVQLPFLQRRLKKPFKLLPAVLNTEKIADLVKIGEVLAQKLKDRKALIVVSADFSHYPRHIDAKQVDETLGLAIKTMNPQYFWLTNRIMLQKGVPELATCACGEAAVTAAMAAVNTLGPAQFLELKYADSYDEFPQQASPDRVVGYMAGVFLKSGKAAAGRFALNDGQKKELLKEARTEIQNQLLGIKAKRERLSADYAFNLPSAVFVTLTRNGALRGCVGTTEPKMTLLDAVRYGALSAAFEDLRFEPVAKGELEKLKIEISILSPLTKASDAKEIIPHKQGVAIAGNGRSGLFLPQVWEQIPGKEDFLGELCSQKAGLERGCWKDKKTDIYVFTVDAFQE